MTRANTRSLSNLQNKQPDSPEKRENQEDQEDDADLEIPAKLRKKNTARKSSRVSVGSQPGTSGLQRRSAGTKKRNTGNTASATDQQDNEDENGKDVEQETAKGQGQAGKRRSRRSGILGRLVGSCAGPSTAVDGDESAQIGRASCRERV